MRYVSLLLIAAAVGCSGDQPPKDVAGAKQTASASDAQPPRAQLGADWMAQRALPARRADVFAPRVAPAPVKPMAQPETVEPAPAPVPPPPFTYAGRVTRGTQSCAVLTRGQLIFFACAPGDALGAGYRVQSIGERELVLLNLAAGIAQTLAISAGMAPGVPQPTALTRPVSIDDVSLQIHGPTRVAIGEQFTLMLSLDSGANDMLEAGRVEVRFDPKVLEIPGQGQSPGMARVEITGAYAGHPAPAMVRFRVVAASPTATEISVVPTNIADANGRTVPVDRPQAHRISIVRGAAAGG